MQVQQWNRKNMKSRIDSVVNVYTKDSSYAQIENENNHLCPINPPNLSEFHKINKK
jgi:hypothetical protein